MNKNTRQTKPLGRSTKEDNAGLSLPQPTLFSFEGQVIKYYNETSKNTFDFLGRLTMKKFSYSSLYVSRFFDTRHLLVHWSLFSYSFSSSFLRPLIKDHSVMVSF